MRTFLAVLPAITPGITSGVMSQHGAASAGNSFVIDLASMGMKSVRDFVFLHTCALAVLCARLPMHKTTYARQG
jgi:hypothetical protein